MLCDDIVALSNQAIFLSQQGLQCGGGERVLIATSDRPSERNHLVHVHLCERTQGSEDGHTIFQRGQTVNLRRQLVLPEQDDLQ